jgi:microcystin-dependent protein
VGVDGAAARLTANDALGNTAGAEKHTLSIAELPAHHHNVPVGQTGSGAAIGNVDAVFSQALNKATDDTGTGTPFDQMQPYQVVQYMIAI